MDPVLVVGAGISGVAAARALAGAGVAVTVLDRGRRVGGRMAVRTTDGRPVDTGASYFTVSDPAFEAVVRDWQARGLAREWTDTFSVWEDGRLSPKPGPVRWASPGSLRALVEDLAEGLDVRQQQVRQVEPGPRVDGVAAPAVLLAMPDPQAERLLHPAFGAETAALTARFDPVMALTATWAERGWAEDLHGVFVTGDDRVAWIADDGSRRGDGAPVLVAHSTSELAAAHLAEPEGARAPMVAAVREVLGLVEPVEASVHRWSFAKPSGSRDQPYVLGDDGIGVCGDSWSDKPRVEAAWLSGTALGRAVAERLA